MKNKTRLSVLMALALASFSVGANEERPCKEIHAACEAAGFVKGGHKKDGKGIFVDCIKKLLNGESVPGVTVPAEQVAACKAKKEKHKEKRMGDKAEKPTMNSEKPAN